MVLAILNGVVMKKFMQWYRNIFGARSYRQNIYIDEAQGLTNMRSLISLTDHWSSTITSIPVPPCAPPLEVPTCVVAQPGEPGYSLLRPTGVAKMPLMYASKMIRNDQIGQLPNSDLFYKNQFAIRAYIDTYGLSKNFHIQHLIYWCENNCSDLFTILPEPIDDLPYISLGFYSEDDAVLFRLAIN